MEAVVGEPCRFAGGKTHGHLRIGALAAYKGLECKASIPSRFETVLNVGQREKNGFGTRTYRFDENENDNPGPGSYSRSRNLAIKFKANYSKKGSAAFASANKVGIGEDATNQTPGPGSYEFRNVISQGQGHSSMFTLPIPKRLLNDTEKPIFPGPGKYFIETPVCHVPCAALCQKGERMIVSPGTNGVDYLEEHHLSCFNKTLDSKNSSSFVSSLGRFGETPKQPLRPNVLPPALTATPEIAHSRIPQVVSDVEKLRVTRPERISLAGERVAKKSYMFADTLLDRFGRPTVRFTAPQEEPVGPGSYNIEKRKKKMLISSSWALSTSSRDEPKDKYLPPGPAYYHPQQALIRESHRMPYRDAWSS